MITAAFGLVGLVVLLAVVARWPDQREAPAWARWAPAVLLVAAVVVGAVTE